MYCEIMRGFPARTDYFCQDSSHGCTMRLFTCVVLSSVMVDFIAVVFVFMTLFDIGDGIILVVCQTHGIWLRSAV